MNSRKLLTLGLSIIAVLAGCTPVLGRSDQTVINVVRVERADDRMELHIALNFPMRYVNHLPVGRGRELLIRIAPLSSASLADCIRFNRETRSVPFARIDVRYIGTQVGGPHLQLNFPSSVTFDVQQGKDFRSIVVVVYLQPVPEEKTMGEPLSGEEGAAILSEAKEAEAAGNLRRAIQLYTKLTERADPVLQEQAQELLADARVANSQLAHARAEYQRYLELYPEGAGSARVERKLAILEAGGDPSAPAELSRRAWSTEWYGDFAQFLEFEGHRISGKGYEEDVSLLDSELNFTHSLSLAGYELNTVFDGGYEIGLNEGTESRGRVNLFYLEGQAVAFGTVGRAGRNYLNKGGIWGRQDGGELSFSVQPDVILNLVAGYPVASSYDEPDADVYFYGANVDILNIGEYLDMNLFLLQQENGIMTDRQAAGGEVRLHQQDGSLLGLVDYDLYYDELNMLLLTVMYNYSEKTSLNLTGEYRQSPYLATSNALIGQQACTLAELKAIYTEEQIEQLAKDRTAESRSAHAGIYHNINDDLQAGFDFTWAKLEETESSGGVDSFEGTDEEFYYLLQLSGTGLITADDIWNTNLRYSDTTYYDVYGARLNTRFRLNGTLQFVPELDVEYRRHDRHNVDALQFSPQLRVEYQLNENQRFELEAGYAWIRRDDTEYEERSEEYFVYLGHYWSF